MASLPTAVHQTFKQWGRQGGKARARKLSAVQRSRIASHAARARWQRHTQPSATRSSIRLQECDWSDPVYVEEILADGALADWKTLYHQIDDYPFGSTAAALERTLHATSMYGVTALWRGILQQLRGGH